MRSHKQLTALRCYGCGRPMQGGDEIVVDLAPARHAFAEPVLMHPRWSPPPSSFFQATFGARRSHGCRAWKASRTWGRVLRGVS